MFISTHNVTQPQDILKDFNTQENYEKRFNINGFTFHFLVGTNSPTIECFVSKEGKISSHVFSLDTGLNQNKMFFKTAKLKSFLKVEFGEFKVVFNTINKKSVTAILSGHGRVDSFIVLSLNGTKLEVV